LTGGGDLLTTAAGALRAMDCVGGKSAIANGACRAAALATGAGSLAGAGAGVGAVGAGVRHHQNPAPAATSNTAAATNHHPLADEASSTSL
jgi:hypothetical protein